MNSTILAGLPTTADISEALWIVAKDYGGHLFAVDEQAVIARQLRAHEALTGRFPDYKEIRQAFERLDLRCPPGYGKAVHARLVRLYGPRSA